MTPAPTVVGTGFPDILHLIGALTLQWIPGIIQSFVGINTPAGITFPPPPSGGPATTADMLAYMQQLSAPGAYEHLARDWGIFVMLSLFISLLLIALIIYCAIRVAQIRRHEVLKLEAMTHPIAARDVPQTQLRWERILKEVASDNDQNRRLAILEADIMLNELLDVLGYRGETMADKMRSVNRANFNTIDKAWAAHRARNQVAHEGSAVQFTALQAQRVVGMYRDVFREFRFIE